MIDVTVIICTYNSSKTITRALDSVFGQKGLYEKFQLQVIVVDDCSKDNTVDILGNYAVKVFQNQTNSGGPNKGRNLALKHAKGEYITFIDHDDEWLPNKIEFQLGNIIDEKVITSGYIDFELQTESKRTISNLSPIGIIRYERNVTFLQKLSRAKKSQKTYFGSIMIHASLKELLFEEEYGMVDFDWVLSVCENQKTLEISEPLFVRYVEKANLSLNEKYRINDLKISSEKIKSYFPKYPKESSRGLKRLNSSMGRYYYLIGDVAKARSYFLNGEFTFVTFLYFLTSFIGREFVVKNFKVFG